MEAWSFDADLIRISDRLADFTLVQNKPVEEFVAAGDRDSQFFVVAAKGVGKTLLLKYKSAKYRRRHDPEFTFIPTNELCEKLTATHVAFAKEDLAAFTTPAHWQDIWKICLMSAVLKALKQPLPPSLESVLGQGTSIGNFLNAILADRKNLFRHTASISTHLSPAIQNVRSPVAVFLDNVDEAMARHVGSDLSRAHQRQSTSLGALSEEVWINAQLGLINAIKAIHWENAHIKIFASVRLEALNADRSPMRTQTLGYCTILDYNDEELQQIFANNVRMTKHSDLVAPAATAQMQRLLGFTTIPHPFVTDPDGSPRIEDAFTYILRHTLRRPRELLRIGKEITHLRPSERTHNTIISLVNNLSTQILGQYQNESVPYWDYDESNAILACIKKNVIPSSEIKQLSSRISTKYTRIASMPKDYHGHPLCSFYRKGLLGFLQRQSYSNELFQTFLPASEYIFNRQDTLPNSPFYFLHPSLAADLRKQHGPAVKFDQENIIGYNYPFTLSKTLRTRRRNLHAHFGAGEIGLGLVAPLLANKANLCIIQQPDSSWDNLSDGSNASTLQEVELRVGQVILKLVVVRDRLDPGITRTAMQKWKNGAHLLVLSQNKSFLQAVLSAAASFSTALKKGLPYATELLTLVTPKSSKDIYCFESELTDIWDFRAQLKRINNRFKIVPVVADRVCRGISFAAGPSGRLINVDCEQSARIYLEDKNSRVRRLFGDHPEVTLAQDDKELTYYRERKYYLMNGIQAVLAFQAYAVLARQNVPLSAWASKSFSLDTRTRYVRTVTKVQICRIIYRNREAMARLYPSYNETSFFNELNLYADEIDARIHASLNLLQKILSADPQHFAEKFERRCGEIVDFVKGHWREVESWQIPSVPSEQLILRELSEFNETVIPVVINAVARRSDK